MLDEKNKNSSNNEEMVKSDQQKGKKTKSSSNNNKNSRRRNNNANHVSHNYEGKGANKPNGNDIAFYNRIPNELTTLPEGTTFHPTGIAATDIPTHTNYDGYDSQPGFIRIGFIPTMGPMSKDDNSIMSMINDVYNIMKSKATLKTDYNAPDLFMATVAQANIRIGYYDLCRMYQSFFTAMKENLMYPENVERVLRLNRATAVNQLDAFYHRLVEFGNRINSFLFPIGFSNEQRWLNLIGGIYTDENTLDAQHYVFQPNYLYRYNPILTEQGGGLELVRWANTVRSWTDYFDVIEDMFNRISTDEDMQFIRADLIKAFGENGSIPVAAPPQYSALRFAYDTNILHQINNMRWYSVSDLPSFNVTQDQSDLYNGPMVQSQPYVVQTVDLDSFVKRTVYLSDGVEASREMMMEATRLMPTDELDGQGTTDCIITGCNSEIVNEVSLYYIHVNTDRTRVMKYVVFDQINTLSGNDAAKLATALKILPILNGLNKFAFAPKIYVFEENNQSQLSLRMTSGDISQYAFISEDVLTRYHRVAQRSMLNPIITNR